MTTIHPSLSDELYPVVNIMKWCVQLLSTVTDLKIESHLWLVIQLWMEQWWECFLDHSWCRFLLPYKFIQNITNQSRIKIFTSDFYLKHFLEAEFAFSVYDHDGSGKIDAQDIGDVLRALNTNPTLALIEKMGGKKKRGEQLLSLEEFLPIYGQVKKEKEQGCYEDFLECLKLYDKNEDGTMLLAELHHTLLALGELRSWLFIFEIVIQMKWIFCFENIGEVLTEEQVTEVFKDCMGAEDEDGNIKYARK